MKKIILLFVLLTIIISQYSVINGTVRFVSKTGSSTPPYTSWATAADSIQKCINISQSGDTIYVANGVYKERVYMIPVLALIGSGMDSCIIDTKAVAVPVEFFSVLFADSCLFKGFTIVTSNGQDGAAIKVSGGITVGTIEENTFTNCWAGCYVMGAVEICNNIFKNLERGISLRAPHPIYQQKIYENVITDFRFKGIGINIGANGEIKNNFFYLDKPQNGSFFMSLSEGLNIANNTIVADDGQSGISNSFQPITNFNNIIIGNFNFAAILAGDGNNIRNNIVINSDEGVLVEQGHNPTIKYNDVWNNNRNFINFSPDSTNISINPMLVNEDDEDFHLQMFSPLIDAGDPSILDKDGSRSDIGVYGGPFGEIYTYVDLAPKPPRGIQSEIIEDTVKVWWNYNTESDFKNYFVYKDSTAGFTPDTTNRLLSVDSSYFYALIQEKKNIYYKITSVDNQNNESEPGEEIAVIVTDAAELKLKTLDSYKLYQNYPNPFNPSTIIGFRLEEAGNVRIVVYDIKGELIIELLNEYRNKGYHEVKFFGKTNSSLNGLASGVYFYRVEVKGENNIPVYGDMKKMLYLK